MLDKAFTEIAVGTGQAVPITRRTLLLSATAAAAPQPRPNILWISCEDTGPQLSCFGDPHAITPTLDRLAAEGVRYSHAYTVAGVCAPSRSGIITGMYPSALGSCHMRSRAPLPSHIKPFPYYLREAGYYTTNNAKTDYNFDPPKSAWDESSRTAHWRNRAPGQPFFAVFNIETTHESRVLMRGPDYAAQTARVLPNQRQDPAKLTTLPPYYPDTPIVRRDWANYYELITDMDHQAAAILRELDDAGLRDDTVVFFWGDHGVGLPRAKRWLYESGTHAPIIASVPPKFRTAGQARPGSVDNRLVSFIDLGPTVLNLAGVPAPAHMHGQAFLGPNLKPPRTHIFGARDRMDETYDMIRSVRDARYRYIRNYMPERPYDQVINTPENGNTMREMRRLHAEGKLSPEAECFFAPRKPLEELYDTVADPHELRNLAADPKHRPALERLRAAHLAWQDEIRDTGFLPEPILDDEGEKLGSRAAILAGDAGLARLKRLRAAATSTNAASLAKSLSSLDPAERWWAVKGLEKLGSKTVRPESLKKLWTDATPAVRIAAARASCLLYRDNEAVAVLRKELGAERDPARLAATHALEDIGPMARPAIPDLQAMLAKQAKSPVQYADRVAARILKTLAKGAA